MNPESKTTKPLTLIAFDFGTKSIGVAVGETLTNTAKPLTAVQASRGVPKWEEIDKLIKEWQPNALIVGIPFNMDGTDQHLTQATRDFANQLKKRYKLPSLPDVPKFPSESDFACPLCVSTFSNRC